jgi:type II secretory pathway component GspD/PulD (secretin)
MKQYIPEISALNRVGIGRINSRPYNNKTLNKTSVVVINQTVVIGGLIEKGRREHRKGAHSKDIPLLGWLFKTQAIRKIK